MLSRVTAKNVDDVFLRQSVYVVLQSQSTASDFATSTAEPLEWTYSTDAIVWRLSVLCRVGQGLVHSSVCNSRETATTNLRNATRIWIWRVARENSVRWSTDCRSEGEGRAEWQCRRRIATEEAERSTIRVLWSKTDPCLSSDVVTRRYLLLTTAN